MIRTRALSLLAVLLLGWGSPALAAFPVQFETQGRALSGGTQTVLPIPQGSLTRIEFTALVVSRLYTDAQISHCYWDIAPKMPPRFTLLFSDVSTDHPYAKHLCTAMLNGIVRGYRDGSFKPDQLINVAEAGKILSRAFVLAPYADWEWSENWYQPHIQALAMSNAIPMEVQRLDQIVTGPLFEEMFARLEKGITNRQSRTYDELKPRPAAIRTTPKPAREALSSSSSSSAVSISSESSSSKKGLFWNPFD